RDSILDRYKGYLQQRCKDGITGTTELLAEIRARGYRGGERTLRRYLINLRGCDQPTLAPPPVPPARDITGWIMRPDGKLTEEHRAELQRLCDLCPDLVTIRDLARGFTDLVRTLGGAHLEAWVKQAEHGAIAEIRSFAAGLRKDWDAVTAGLTMQWSSGAVEGNVNRIKMLSSSRGHRSPRLSQNRT
ncbi:ISL3 family transposase, partial [Actinoplanes sp. ATCC 53533]|uniref:transposase n=1 Tax=Actinoplanes sp. ATCC 53533 TaxID=1288362 RepID=UPI0010028137